MKKRRVLVFLKTETFANFFLFRYLVIWFILRSRNHHSFKQWCCYAFDKNTLVDLLFNKDFLDYYEREDEISPFSFECKLDYFYRTIDDSNLRIKIRKITKRL